MFQPARARLALPAVLIAAATAMSLAPSTVEAFCGFYVSGADAKLFNNATQVVMMRDGTKTVLSMQNNYQGPTEDFAMVVPVPVVLQKENVKTLPKDIFDKVDKMAAPRLVEYWERDPCWEPVDEDDDGVVENSAALDPGDMGEGGVKVEAQFKVGEYEIVILSADDSGGLNTWLKDNKYNIPKGAEPALKPYVEAGTKFFVAKVDAKKVTFKDGEAVLSPLRFHYDSKDFQLPVRLGLLNAQGPQDVIVHILSPRQRYEVANYKNVTIPTNIGVGKDAKSRFGEFYAALFDRTLEKNPGAVVTEYAWNADTCDPCPGPPLTAKDFKTLGADVTGKERGLVLTRLHARYTKDSLNEDLIFKAADPILGGREHRNGDELEKGATAGKLNNFQGRYIIRNPWEGEIKCDDPVRGRWGGPPEQQDMGPSYSAAQDLANAPRGKVNLPDIVREDIPEIGLKTAGAPTKLPETTPKASDGETKAPAEVKEKSCGCVIAGNSGSPAAPLGGMALLLGALWLRRKR